APEPCGSLAAGTPKRITAGTPSCARSCTSLRSDSRVCCTTPGSEAISRGWSMPSRTNKGTIRSSTDSRVSATRRRRAGVRRRRRSRRWGKLTPRCYGPCPDGAQARRGAPAGRRRPAWSPGRRESARDQVLRGELGRLALEVDEVAGRDEVVALALADELVLGQHQRLAHVGVVRARSDVDAGQQQAGVAD